MRFSVSTQAFYADEINFGDNLPPDIVDLTSDQELQFYEAVNNGCFIYMANGILVSSEPRPDLYHSWDSDSQSWVITDENAKSKKNDELEKAEEEKQERIDQANEYMNSKQWPGKAALGRLNDTDKDKYNAWLDYLDALEAVDTTSAPDIEWPEQPK
ncbi:tail fiber assembly protein [Citrobacter koseri]|uniref:tail fiber assembly protein n=1 Tax=Citrobacter koseri TaxID=545 RepID=UPI001D475058|nr:tail fiber assembly protein [Citrobacter koseri]CAG0264827.1 Prophage tail fiber assembly protein TfaE [Citrobacter koseri]CAH6100594.1 Prophage tail fiber assembly protein TfaE [Citrobacter koseri]